MAVRTKAQLKSYFETGDKPTQSEFEDLIDTLLVQEQLGDEDVIPTITNSEIDALT